MQPFHGRSAAIKGKVSDEAGKPVEKARVTLGVLVDSGEGTQVTGVSAHTDHEGHYLISNLAPGRYLAQAEPPAPTAQSPYPTVLFPGVTDSADATSLVVRSGDEIGGINFTFKPQTHVRLQMDASLLLKAAGPGATASVTVGSQTVRANSDGIASFEKLFPGHYRVFADAGPDGGTRFFSATAETDVGSESPGLLKLNPEAQFELAGQFVGNREGTGAAAADSSTMVVFRPLGFGIVLRITMAKVQQGSFRVPGIFAGTYMVSVTNLRPGYFVSEMTIGTVPIPASGIVTVHAGDAINIRVSDEGATFSGRTITPDGKTFAGGVTVLVDPNSLQSIKTIIVRIQENGETGTAVFQAQKPGAWIALAFDSFDLALLRNLEVLRKYLPSGVKVDLSPRESKVLNLPLIHFED